MRNRFNSRRGFTLTELLVAVSIMVVVALGASIFQKNIFSLSLTFQGSLSYQLGARATLKSFTSEVREASPSSLGAYPIEEASTTEFIFFSDTDNDGQKERLRYFLSGTNFKKGVIKPSGNPLSYNTGNEKISTLISNVSNGTTTVFEYYNTNYTGTSSPLTQPVSVSEARLVKLTLVVNPDPRNPSPFMLVTQVSMRNLKDNL